MVGGSGSGTSITQSAADTQRHVVARKKGGRTMFRQRSRAFLLPIVATVSILAFGAQVALADDEEDGAGAGHILFVTDAPSRVVTIDLNTDAILDTASTGGDTGLRADELAYDPADGLLLVVNNADSPPFASLIKVNKQTGKLTADTKAC